MSGCTINGVSATALIIASIASGLFSSIAITPFAAPDMRIAYLSPSTMAALFSSIMR